jgi:hypothetical protein
MKPTDITSPAAAGVLVDGVPLAGVVPLDEVADVLPQPLIAIETSTAAAKA